MCEYMINFIHKLKNLPEKYMMNSVLENFTILQVCSSLMFILRKTNIFLYFVLLQVITNIDTQETLLCIAYVFEVSESAGTQHHIYRLTKDWRSSHFCFVTSNNIFFCVSHQLNIISFFLYCFHFIKTKQNEFTILFESA